MIVRPRKIAGPSNEDDSHWTGSIMDTGQEGVSGMESIKGQAGSACRGEPPPSWRSNCILKIPKNRPARFSTLDRRYSRTTILNGLAITKRVPVFHVGLDHDQATALIADMTRHLPIGASLGRIRAVTRHGVLTDDALYGFDPVEDHAWRLVTTDFGVNEWTYWRDGVELRRWARRHYDV
jgi:hypothetical protein